MKTLEEQKEKAWKYISTSLEGTFKAMKFMYGMQTGDEQRNYMTKERNEVGFNKIDAGFGTDMAKRMMSGRRISRKQLEACRRMLRKYVGQMVDSGWPERS